MASGLDNNVKGAGHWAAGTTVREIEGHFNPANEPKGVPPISGDGGVPDVDYSTKDKIKDAITGHHHDSSATGTTTGSSQATHGISETAERDLKKHDNSTGFASTNATGTGAPGTTAAAVPQAESSISGQHTGTKADAVSGSQSGENNHSADNGAHKEGVLGKIKHALGSDKDKEHH